MISEQRWKWAGIVSVISIGGVLLTDIVANVVSGYISDQIKQSWLEPQQQGSVPNPEPAIAERATAATAPAATAPSRHAPPPDSLQEVEALAMGIRSLVSRTVSERVPLGWSALILCPPAHPHQMTWHIHLGPRIALDLNDGRTVPASAPEATHAWQLPGGRTVQLSDGDPDPAPTVETTNVRVTGPYFAVSMTCEAGQEAQIVARVLGDGADDLPQPRASAHDVRAVQGALRSAVELAVSSKMLGAAPVVGYRPASWAAHERVWLTVEQ